MQFQFLILLDEPFPNNYLHCSRIILESIWQTVALIYYCFHILLWHTIHIICSITTILSFLIQSCKVRCSHYLLYITKFIVTRSRQKNRILSKYNIIMKYIELISLNRLSTYWSNIYFNFICIGNIHKLFNWKKLYYICLKILFLKL